MKIKEFKGLGVFRGLMFRKIDPNILYVFNFAKPGKYPIHTFFVKDTIDVAWFDKSGIIDIKTVKPWKPYVTHKGKALGFCECKSGNLIF